MEREHNEDGRGAATGKRKTAIARVRVQSGTGQIQVNDRPLEEYFPRTLWATQVKAPIEITNMTGKLDIFAKVTGGGLTGQAEAIRHGISRALLEINPEFRESLKKEGFLTRDARVKERKKFGQKGARKRFQFSKR
ncbi:MAG: 30S ribosomal protein S9 [Leptospirillia bacterium]|jgi:small subunit ribosomal protein S9|uniref:Small ribosomal subunit protein uS9 n=1 Tax=Leptospirillum ferrodiazotrophum TaxID=412449 RepID=C6HZ56_9BACT|nr:MAG: ribosomal protein S9 [Leptospirillum ferrodiazotrophum]MCL5953230.1 30S ribosomal protein S9 [Nitrospirota bacterium]